MALRNTPDLTHKVCLITGGTSGIGLASARALAKMGAELFLVCRNPEKGQRVIDQMASETGNPKLNLLIGDLASLSEVRRIAQEFLKYEKPLHILLNNAGVYAMKRNLARDNLEEMFAVNHLSHFLLTNLFLDRMKLSSEARIVNVASGAHMLVRQINFEDLNFDNGFRSLKVYSHSKLANMLFTHELARRLADCNITVNSADPGEVGTNLGSQNGVFGKVISRLMKLFLQSPEKGAKTSVYLCTSDEVDGVTGKYFRNCREKEPKSWARNNKMAKRLWAVSEQLTSM